MCSASIKNRVSGDRSLGTISVPAAADLRASAAITSVIEDVMLGLMKSILMMSPYSLFSIMGPTTLADKY